MVKMDNIDKPRLNPSATREVNTLQRIILKREELKLFARSVDYSICYLYPTVLEFRVVDLVSRLINRVNRYVVG
jgi:hypothetical protein